MGAEERGKTHTGDKHYWTKRDLEFVGKNCTRSLRKVVKGTQSRCMEGRTSARISSPPEMKKMVAVSLRAQPPRTALSQVGALRRAKKKMPIVLAGKEEKKGENQVQVLPPGTIPSVIQLASRELPPVTPPLGVAVAVAPLGLSHSLAKAAGRVAPA